MTPQLPIARLNWYHCHLSLRVDRTILFGVCEREREIHWASAKISKREREPFWACPSSWKPLNNWSLVKTFYTTKKKKGQQQT